MHAVPAASQYFVRVGLVAHVPDNSVMGGVEYVVQCDGQFDHAQSGAEVPAGAGDGIQQIMPQLVSDLHQLLRVKICQRAQVRCDGV